MNTHINPKDGSTLIWVPSGTFMMGSNEFEVRQLWTKNEWHEDWFNAQVGGKGWVGELFHHEVEIDVRLNSAWHDGNPLKEQKIFL